MLGSLLYFELKHWSELKHLNQDLELSKIETSCINVFSQHVSHVSMAATKILGFKH